MFANIRVTSHTFSLVGRHRHTLNEMREAFGGDRVSQETDQFLKLMSPCKRRLTVIVFARTHHSGMNLQCTLCIYIMYIIHHIHNNRKIIILRQPFD